MDSGEDGRGVAPGCSLEEVFHSVRSVADPADDIVHEHAATDDEAGPAKGPEQLAPEVVSVMSVTADLVPSRPVDEWLIVFVWMSFHAPPRVLTLDILA